MSKKRYYYFIKLIFDFQLLEHRKDFSNRELEREKNNINKYELM